MCNTLKFIVELLWMTEQYHHSSIKATRWFFCDCMKKSEEIILYELGNHECIDLYKKSVAFHILLQIVLIFNNPISECLKSLKYSFISNMCGDILPCDMKTWHSIGINTQKFLLICMLQNKTNCHPLPVTRRK